MTVEALQTLHILGIAAVLGPALMISRSLWGARGAGTVQASLRRYVPALWAGLAVLAATGASMIVADPARELGNPAFRVKLVLLAAALVFLEALRRAPPRSASLKSRALAAASFALWLAIVAAGRWIAYSGAG